MARRVKLTDVEGEIRNVRFGNSLMIPALHFVCPICLEANGGVRAGVHSHMVPFRWNETPGRSGAPITHVWGHDGGRGVDDLTLSPSYLARGGSCRFHCFVRNGVLEVLSDSTTKWARR